MWQQWSTILMKQWIQEITVLMRNSKMMWLKGFAVHFIMQLKTHRYYTQIIYSILHSLIKNCSIIIFPPLFIQKILTVSFCFECLFFKLILMLNFVKKLIKTLVDSSLEIFIFFMIIWMYYLIIIIINEIIPNIIVILSGLYYSKTSFNFLSVTIFSNP